MRVIANHVHYVMKINQAFPIFLVYVEKHGKAWVRGYRQHTLELLNGSVYLSQFLQQIQPTTSPSLGTTVDTVHS